MSITDDIGLDEALRITLDVLAPLPPVEIPVVSAVGRVTAAGVTAAVDSPSATTSLKDGFALSSADVSGASASRPVRLRVEGFLAAGSTEKAAVSSGTCVRIMTGAPIPPGADAVLPVELTRPAEPSACTGEHVDCLADAHPGRNILRRGADVEAGKLVVPCGERLRPATCGLLAAAGAMRVAVHPAPRVGIIATGDEVVAPGTALSAGQLYASNLVTLMAWLTHFGMEPVEAVVVSDSPGAIRTTAAGMLGRVDAVLTSGGAWKSERDRTVRQIRELGGRTLFHRVRMGPGKAVALTMAGSKPVFSLPGGPPSNEMAFLQVALPGLLRLAGADPAPFRIERVRLGRALSGEPDWTQLHQARLVFRDGERWAEPLRRRDGSRLRSQAEAEAIVRVPEGASRIEAGEWVDAQVLFGDARAPR